MSGYPRITLSLYIWSTQAIGQIGLEHLMVKYANRMPNIWCYDFDDSDRSEISEEITLFAHELNTI